MKKFPRGALAFLLVTLLSCPAFPASAADKGKSYFSVSLGGFSSSLFPEAEYLDLAASVEFAKGRALDPTFSMHWLFPANPLSLADSFAGLGLDTTLFYMENHPFAWVSPRKTAWAPSIGAAAYVPVLDLENICYTANIAPFRIFTGYGYFSLGSFSLVFDAAFDLDGWGLKLFEFSNAAY